MGLDTYHRERGEAVRHKNRRELGLDPEGQIDRVASWLRRPRLPRWAWALMIPVCILGGAWLAMAAASPWPMSVTVRHLMAAPNCDAARVVGLAPAARGAPGYWSRHDADGDGIACEPWPWVTITRPRIPR
jgi:hypothetical protein